jgi:PST family polysaccharide transporter
VVLIGIFGYFYTTKGVLFAFILSQVILFGVGLFFLKKTPIRLQLFAPSIDRLQLKQLLSFSLMSVTSVIATPMAQLFLRNYVAGHSSWAEVGYWQAMVRISDAYLMIITMIISTYALPKYARISCNKALATEISQLFKRLIPIAVGMAGGIYILKKYVILILFSSEFLVMKPLFLFQLIGDVFKISSWIMANVIVAKAKIKVYIVLELIFTVSFVLLSVLFFQHSAIKGLSMAFCLNYIGYFVAVGTWLYFFLKKPLETQPNP